MATASQEKMYKEKLPWQQVLSLSSANFSQAVMLTTPFTIGVFMVRDFQAARHGGREEVDEQVVGRLTGLLAGIFSFSSFLTAYAWGCASNSIGRKPVIIVGNAVSFVSMLWFGLSGSYGIALASRAFGGFLNGILGAWKCMIGESTDVLLQGKFFGYMSLAWGLGCIAGPALGGAFSRPCSRLPHLPLCGEGQLLRARPYFLACSVGSLTILAALLLSVLLLEETLPPSLREKGLVAVMRKRRRRRYREQRRLLKQQQQQQQDQSDADSDPDLDLGSRCSDTGLGAGEDLAPRRKPRLQCGGGGGGTAIDSCALQGGVKWWGWRQRWRRWRRRAQPQEEAVVIRDGEFCGKASLAGIGTVAAATEAEEAVTGTAGLATERAGLLSRHALRSDDLLPHAPPSSSGPSSSHRGPFPTHHRHRHRQHDDVATATSHQDSEPEGLRGRGRGPPGPHPHRMTCPAHPDPPPPSDPLRVSCSTVASADMSTSDDDVADGEDHHQQLHRSHYHRDRSHGHRSVPADTDSGRTPSQLQLQAVLRLASRTYIGINPFARRSFGRRSEPCSSETTWGHPHGPLATLATTATAIPIDTAAAATAASTLAIELQGGCSRGGGGNSPSSSYGGDRGSLKAAWRSPDTSSSPSGPNGDTRSMTLGDAPPTISPNHVVLQPPPQPLQPPQADAAESLPTAACAASAGKCGNLDPGHPHHESQCQSQCQREVSEAGLRLDVMRRDPPQSTLETGGASQGVCVGYGSGGDDEAVGAELCELQRRVQTRDGGSGDGSGGGNSRGSRDLSVGTAAGAVHCSGCGVAPGGFQNTPTAVSSSNGEGHSFRCSSYCSGRCPSHTSRCYCCSGNGAGSGNRSVGGGRGSGSRSIGCSLATLPEDQSLYGGAAFRGRGGGGGGGSEGAIQSGASKQPIRPDEPPEGGDDLLLRVQGFGEQQKRQQQEVVMVVEEEQDGPKRLLPWFRYPQVVLTILGYGATALIFCAIDEVFPIFASAPRTSGGLGMREEQIAPPLIFFGAVLMPYSLYGYPPLQRHVGTLRLTRVGLLASVVTCLMVPLVADLRTASAAFAQVFLYLAMVVKAFAQCSAFTGSIIAVNAAPAPEQLGAVNGVGQTLAALVRGAGPALGGLLWAVSLGLHSAGQQFLTFGMIAAVAAANFWLYGFVRLPNMR